MFSKETQVLVKPVYEAIKILAERQEKECSECNGQGITGFYKKNVGIAGISVVNENCSTCNGTGKIRRKMKVITNKKNRDK